MIQGTGWKDASMPVAREIMISALILSFQYRPISSNTYLIGHHPEQANWSVNQIQAEAIPQDLIRKQSVVTKPHLDILQIHAPLEQPPQDGLPRIDHLEEMLCDGRVHGPSRPPSDSDLYLVTELAVGILQEGSKDATPRPSASASDPQPVAI
ncbi:hypothetical protein BHE74_00006034 [Ensete ventricosum]|nr:hypothetical protein BHE74_00006034 [Ensete ventricosum]